MCFRTPNVPIDIQCQAACAAVSVHRWREVKHMLGPYGYRDPNFLLLFRMHRIRRYLTFTPAQLLEYMQQHTDMCRELLVDCGDKRSTPNTLIERVDFAPLYQVGMYHTRSGRTDLRYFATLEEAITDYVLFSLGFPRLATSMPEAGSH